MRAVFGPLRQYLRDRRFWVVQALVLCATAIHLSEDGLEALRGRAAPDLFVVFMYGIFFVPVIYASLNFGRAGAIPTAVWAAILAIPSILFFHSGADRFAEIVQHLTIIALAAVIASRVDREVEARRDAEREGLARKLSEAKYRTLFASARDAIVVFNADGIVEEANAAAAALFGQPEGTLPGTPVADLVGNDQAAYLTRLAASGEVGGDDLRLTPHPGVELWVEPVCNTVRIADDQSAAQVVFRDVTERRTALQGVQTYARQIVTAQEDERKRIARDLHDGSVQSVVLLCRQIDGLTERANRLIAGLRQEFVDLRLTAAGTAEPSRDQTSPAKRTRRPPLADRLVAAEAETDRVATAFERDLEAVHHAAEGIAQELRDFSWNLRPSILDDLGLVPAVEWLVHDLADRTGIRGEFGVTGVERRLPSQLEPGLFRIAQEALRNVERHAQAAGVTVHLAYEVEQVRLTVEDDGLGLSLAEGQTSSSLSGKLGLLGMRERARLLGGSVRIRSTPGHGTQVHVVVPLPSASQPA
jgi:PAS domain S-box-containing protein